MSMATESFDRELEKELRDTGLPTNPREVIGRVYRFGCKKGSHHFILVGTITAIEISDEGGFKLIVSNREIWGMQLKSIAKTDPGWEARVLDDVTMLHFHGELEIY